MTETLVQELTPEVALDDLGVKPELLTPGERRCLDVDGLTVMENVIPEEQLQPLRDKIDEKLSGQRVENMSDEAVRAKSARSRDLFDHLVKDTETKIEAGGAPELEDLSPEKVDELLAGYRRMRDTYGAAVDADDVAAMRTVIGEGFNLGFFDGEFVEDQLFETDPIFDLTISSPRVLSGVAYVLGPMFHLLNVVCRCPRPGEGQQALHRTEYSARRIVTTLWLIDDMVLDNGPTRVIPGSHLRSDGLPAEMEGDPKKTHPAEIKLIARAGSVVVFDDRTWHGGSMHLGGGPRRVVISSFVQRALYPSIVLYRPEETLARLSPGQRWLLHPEAQGSQLG
jgi:ectoine hydroxylase-related dioxygenase (phytanoyl-CoA dioxygenase family)